MTKYGRNEDSEVRFTHLDFITPCSHGMKCEHLPLMYLWHCEYDKNFSMSSVNCTLLICTITAAPILVAAPCIMDEGLKRRVRYRISLKLTNFTRHLLSS